MPRVRIDWDGIVHEYHLGHQSMNELADLISEWSVGPASRSKGPAVCSTPLAQPDGYYQNIIIKASEDFREETVWVPYYKEKPDGS